MERPSLNGGALSDESLSKTGNDASVQKDRFAVPEGVIILAAGCGDEAAEVALMNLSAAPTYFWKDAMFAYYGVRVSGPEDFIANLELEPIKIYMPEEQMPASNDEFISSFKDAEGRFNTLDLHVCAGASRTEKPKLTMLDTYSLLGDAAELEANAQAAEPMLGSICHKGQVTVLYAPPNAGKTLLTMRLLLDAIAEGRVHGSDVYYVNADDSSEGLAVKARLFEDAGVNMLAPGFKGFETSMLVPALEKMAADKSASGKLFIIDTLKKTTDLMNKAHASAVGDICRKVGMAGGTVLALAHTNKNPSPSGQLVYSGTGDIVQDFDCAYIITPIPTASVSDHKAVEVEAIKRRGAGVQKTAYRYSTVQGEDYPSLVASVEELDPDAMSKVKHVAAEQNASECIDAIKAAISSGVNKKMPIVHGVAKELAIPQRAVLHTLEQFCGKDHSLHHWAYTVQARGAHVYQLLASASD